MIVEKFKYPDNQKKIAPFWSWNDNLVSQELKRQIDEMKASGYGGFFMHSRVGLITGYLSDRWIELIRDCADYAQEVGMSAWLYDEDKWPSGYAGGIVPKEKESYREKALLFLTKEQMMDDDVVIKQVETQDGERFICKRTAKLGNPWFNLSSYIDTMDKEAVAFYLQSTHHQYQNKLKGYLGTKIDGIFTDEPCYNMYCFQSQPYAPWSTHFSEEFLQRKGYLIEDKAEELFLDIGDYHKTRFDYYDCASSLFLENFTIQYAQWCAQNNMKMTGHYMSEETLVSQICWLGSVMPHYEYQQMPGVDKLFNNQDQLVTLKQLTSVSEQLGKSQALCECFAGMGHDSGVVTRKWIADWQAVNGISFINPHLSLYSMRGERKRDYPPNLFYQQPWWGDETLFAEYASRLCTLSAFGRRAVRIAILHPITSAWCEFNPCEKDAGYPRVTKNYDEPFSKFAAMLQSKRIDYHFADEVILQRHSKVDDDKLVIGNNTYNLLVIPSCCNLRKSSAALLKQFSEQGGRIVTFGQFPSRIEGEQADISLNTEYRGEDAAQTADYLGKQGFGNAEVKDLVSGQISDKVICSIREDGGQAVILFANTDNLREIRAEITIPRKGVPVVMCLCSGKIYTIPYYVQADKIVLEATLYPAGSLALMLFDSEQEAKDVADGCIEAVQGILNDGVAFSIKGKPKMTLLTPSEVRCTDQNVLPLSKVDFELDGQLLYQDTHCSAIWHRNFYNKPDGTPFSAIYRFSVDSIPEGTIFAAIEGAENLDAIEINDQPVKPMRKAGEPCILDEKAWLDVSFTRVDLTGKLKVGENSLRIRGKKRNNIIGVGTHVGVEDFEHYRPTELDVIYLVGHFGVMNMDNMIFHITKTDGKTDGKNIVADGYPFYAGKISYRYHLTLPNSPSLMLALSNYTGTTARCMVNSQCVGVAGFRPYQFDLSEFGGQTVEIEIIASNDLYNLMGPAYIRDLKSFPWVDPGIFNDVRLYTDRLKLNSFGMEGVILFSM